MYIGANALSGSGRQRPPARAAGDPLFAASAQRFRPASRVALTVARAARSRKPMTVVGVLGSARELLERFETKPDGERKSMAFLIEALKGGPRLASELTAEAEKAGINGRTLRRAFKELGGTPERHGAIQGHFVVWDPCASPEDRPAEPPGIPE